MIVTKTDFILTDEEKDAVANAHEIVEVRCKASGVIYDEAMREQVTWCFMGAMHIGGISAVMQYAKEAPIRTKRRD